MENKYKDIKIGVVEDYPICQQVEKASNVKDLVKDLGGIATYIAINLIEMEGDFRFDISSINGEVAVKKVGGHIYAYLKQGGKIYSIVK